MTRRFQIAEEKKKKSNNCFEFLREKKRENLNPNCNLTEALVIESGAPSASTRSPDKTDLIATVLP